MWHVIVLVISLIHRSVNHYANVGQTPTMYLVQGFGNRYGHEQNK